MKFLRIAGGLIATAFLGFIARDARATYSGVTTRTICPATVIVPTTQSAFGNDWNVVTNRCGVGVSGVPSGSFAFATVALPYESTTAQTVTITLMVHGGALGGGNSISAEARSFNPDGSLFTNSNNPIFNGQQPLVMSLSVPANGAISINVAAQGNATLDMLQMQWDLVSE
jgi:hypothetical protein